LKQKLVLFVSNLIILTIFIQSFVSYISLSQAYDTAIGVAKSNFDSMLKTEVESIVSVLQVNYNRVQNGEISSSQALETAKKIIRDTRYNSGAGYFWADLEDGTNVVHMNPKYEGKMRYQDKDLKGNFYIQNLISAGNQKSGGFTDYYFSKPDEEGSFLKRAFTLKFEPYGWYISAGNYQVDIDALTQKYNSEKQAALLRLIFYSFFIFIFGSLFMYLIANSIAKPLGKVTERLRLLSEGDLHSPVPAINTQDETKMLAEATEKTISILHGTVENITSQLEMMSNGNLHQILEVDYLGDMQPIKGSIHRISTSLSNTFSQISQSANQVAAGASQVSDGAQILAQGAAEQASAVNSLSSAVYEISEEVEQNAIRTATVNDIAHKAAVHTQQGKNQLTQMMNAMASINESSQQIEGIVRSIDDIAFQTNILALNAAVEAARAGSAGQGFAVVANEVRSLASKSAQAAKDTAVLIKNSMNTVEEGNKTANETVKLLNQIIDDAKSTGLLIEQISDSSNHQANSVKQMILDVDQISAVVQTTSSASEESAASSEELSSLAQSMNNLINQFKLTENQ
jgi:methyl-accepting chemotaxis protein